MWWHDSRGQQVVNHCSCGVGQTTCSKGGLDITSNFGLEGDQMTDRCSTTIRRGQVCPGEVACMSKQWAATMDDWIDHRARDWDVSDRRRLCSAGKNNITNDDAPLHVWLTASIRGLVTAEVYQSYWLAQLCCQQWSRVAVHPNLYSGFLIFGHETHTPNSKLNYWKMTDILCWWEEKGGGVNTDETSESPGANINAWLLRHVFQ